MITHILNILKIKVFDDFLPNRVCQDLFEKICEYPFYRTEKDFKGSNKTGLTHDLTHNHDIKNYILQSIKVKNVIDLEKYKIKEFYINLFLPNENPKLHIDSSNKQDITFLLYISPNKYNENEKGTTDFLFGNFIFGVRYKQNRVITFPSTFLHKANSFLTEDRLSIAIKFEKYHV